MMIAWVCRSLFVFSKSQDDDSMTMCLSKSQDGHSMTMCLSKSQYGHSMMTVSIEPLSGVRAVLKERACVRAVLKSVRASRVKGACVSRHLIVIAWRRVSRGHKMMTAWLCHSLCQTISLGCFVSPSFQWCYTETYDWYLLIARMLVV